MTSDLIVVVVAFCGVVGIFLGLSAILAAAEKVSPRFKAWVDTMDERPPDRGF